LEMVNFPFTNFKSRRSVVIGVGSLVAAGAFLLFLPPCQPEHDGEPLTYHLASLSYGDVRRERAAREAIRAMGPASLPHLIRILEKRESPLKVRCQRLLERQRLVRFRTTPLRVHQTHAALACAELGPAAAPAIPALAALIEDPNLTGDACAALSQIGPQTLPLLTNALRSTSALTRVEAAGHLRNLRPRDLPVPALLQALHDTNAPVRSRTAESLGALGCASDRVVPALIACLDDPDLAVRLSAAQSLGWLGPAAAPALPTLIELLRKEEMAPAGSHLAQAIKTIDPSAAEGAGVE
jgi:HEAT repeat protein